MNISSVLTKENIIMDVQSINQEQVINELTELMNANGYLNNVDQFKKDIWQREKEISTEVGYGVAIPHAKSDSVKKTAVVFGRSLQGVQYGSEKCHFIFLIGATQGASNKHLQTLSKLSTFLLDETFRAKLILANNQEEVMQIFKEEEAKVEDKENEANKRKYMEKRIVGVTGCPTGIAHTFMAAESLKKEAAEMGIQIKVQTNGAAGVENQLTENEIRNADGVIVAADVRVDMDVFQGKRVIKGSTNDAIHHASRLISEALSGKGQIYHPELKSAKGPGIERNRPDIFKHLMTGVSYMIPVVVAGGILIAVSFMFGINAGDPKSSQYNEFAAFLNTAGAKAGFALMVPVLAGFIAYSIADRPGLAPGFIGGMMATLGGSGFIGGMIAGFVAGYTVRELNRWLKKMPDTFQGINSILLLPVFGSFTTALIMHYVINTPFSLLNGVLENWLHSMSGTNAFLLGALLAGMMAIDMGGPINKTAAAFGLAMFANRIFEPMAALMAGGMVPPLGIALATTLFKNRFTDEERNAGKAAYVMGACFITEGAIPFAAKDPFRIIPASVIGAAISGGISMGLHISLTAPHGGIFVIPIAASNPILYSLSIIVGAFITAVIVGFLKKQIVVEERKSQSTIVETG